MKLFLDCEWDGPAGPTVSIALVPQIGEVFYGICRTTAQDPWVGEHVIPVLSTEGFVPTHMAPDNDIGMELSRYLWRIALKDGARTPGDRQELTIIADHPEDIARFCRLIQVNLDKGQTYSVPLPLTFDLAMHLSGTSRESEVPHNALADAHAISRLHHQHWVRQRIGE